MKNILYAKDFGMKSSQTAGRMRAGENKITVKSAAGFAVGDTIIVEVGGEDPFHGRAGGALKTKGVGDTSPSLSYPNFEAMQADTTRPNNLRAWCEDTGEVFINSTGTWNPASVPIMVGDYVSESRWYDKWAVPKALRTKITAINGKVFTVNKPAHVNTTNANVYFDNAYILTRLCMPFDTTERLGNYDLFTEIDTSRLDEENKIIQLPKGGNLPIGEVCYVFSEGMTLKGAGIDATRIFSPRGVGSANLYAWRAHNSVIQDFTIEGNAKLDGFGSFWDTWIAGDRQWTVTDYMSFQFPDGFFFENTNDAKAYNIKVKDCFVGAGSAVKGCNNVYRKDIICERSTPLMMYLQWHFMDADSADCTYKNCNFSSPYIHKAYNSFSSLRTKYINCHATNGIWAFNSASDFLLENCTQTFTGNNKPVAIHANEPAVNINTNIGRGGSGGNVNNHIIILEDYVDDNLDCIKGIVINAQNKKIKITGGSYTAPDHASPIGPSGIISEGEDIVIDGFVVNGQPAGTSFYEASVSIRNGEAKNIIAPVIFLGENVTQSNLAGTIVNDF